MRKEVELLEDHAGTHAHFANTILALAPLCVEWVRANDHAINLDGAIGRILKEVQAAQEGALPGARSPEDADGFAWPHGDGCAAEHVVLAEPLGDVRGFEHRLGARLHENPRLLSRMDWMRGWRGR